MQHDRNDITGMPIVDKPRPRTDDEQIHATTQLICTQSLRDPLFADAVVSAAAWIIANSTPGAGNADVEAALVPFRKAVSDNILLASDGGTA